MKLAHTRARVERIRPLTDSIIELILDPEHYIDYRAGQYLQMASGKEFLSYSIANAPLGSHKYELHIRHNQVNPYDQPLFKQIRETGTVDLRLPLGECHLESLKPHRPILFIAGGTGFSQVKAMIEQLLATGSQGPFELYWGARSRSDLYMEPLVRQWQSHARHFAYVSLLPNQEEDFASLIMNRHAEDISLCQIVLSGPFDMVYATRDALVSQGVAKSLLFSDAFYFETGRKT